MRLRIPAFCDFVSSFEALGLILSMVPEKEKRESGFSFRFYFFRMNASGRSFEGGTLLGFFLSHRFFYFSILSSCFLNSSHGVGGMETRRVLKQMMISPPFFYHSRDDMIRYDRERAGAAPRDGYGWRSSRRSAFKFFFFYLSILYSIH